MFLSSKELSYLQSEFLGFFFLSSKLSLWELIFFFMAADGDYAPYHNHTENSHQKCENGTEEKTPPFPLFQTLFIRQDGVLGGHGGLLHWGWGGEGQQAGHVIHGSSKRRKVVSVLGFSCLFYSKLLHQSSLLSEEEPWVSFYSDVLQLESCWRRRCNASLKKREACFPKAWL